MQLKNLVIDFIGSVMRNGGIIANFEHAQERLEVCKKCEYFGEVQPLPLLKVEGCTQCGCPTKTKTMCIQNLDADTGKMKKTRCGNAEKGGVDYWESIDKKYNYGIE